jgi:hypothetical protein
MTEKSESAVKRMRVRARQKAGQPRRRVSNGKLFLLRRVSELYEEVEDRPLPTGDALKEIADIHYGGALVMPRGMPTIKWLLEALALLERILELQRRGFN